MTLNVNDLEVNEEKSKEEKIYLKYRQQMFYVAYRLLENKELAEQAVRHTLVKTFKYMKQMDTLEVSRSRSLLMILVERHAINLYRKKNQDELLCIEQLENRTKAYLGLPLTLKKESPLVRGILGLPHHYVNVLLLRYSSGYSERKIAMYLELTEGQIKKRLQKAQMKLRYAEVMKGQEFDEVALKEASKKAENILLTSIPYTGCNHLFSKAFKQRMEQIIEVRQPSTKKQNEIKNEKWRYHFNKDDAIVLGLIVLAILLVIGARALG